VKAPADGPSGETMINALVTLDEGEGDLEEEQNDPPLTGEWQKSVTTLRVARPTAGSSWMA
jgi:hypothetical protein